MPKVTVLMPVYNGGAFIKEAIDSVLKQSFIDFELIIMDDGSTDNTGIIIGQYTDVRIRYERRSHNFIGNLNEGIYLAKGKYIARMDADDIMHSERLRIQVRVMENIPEIMVCGSWMKNFGVGIMPQIFRSFNGEIDFPLIQMLKGNILFHPTIMLRKDFLLDNRLLYKEYQCAEDYKLYADIARLGGMFYVEPQVLLFYRNSPKQVTQSRKEEVAVSTRKIREEIVNILLEGIDGPVIEVINLYHSLKEIEKKGLLNEDRIFEILYEVFQKIKPGKTGG